MKAICAIAALGLSLVAPMGSASAQYGSPDYGYGGREREYGRDRDYGRDRNFGYEERGRGYKERAPRDQEYGFNERAYLRCNPDVARAVAQGRMQSGFMHYQGYGRREGRRLSC
jgi:hypothetical protein